jgi:hypothetical protein
MLPCKPLMVVDHPLGTTARGLSIVKLILRRQLCTVRITCRLPCPTTRETQAERQLFTGDMLVKCIIPRRITLPWEPWRSCRPEMLRGLWTSTPSRLPISMAITGTKWAAAINMISIMAVNSIAYLSDTCSTDKMEMLQVVERQLNTELLKATIIALACGPLTKPRYINPKIEAELVDFKKEIEEKFGKSKLRSFKFPLKR